MTSSPLHSPQQRRNCSTNFNQDGKTRKVSTQLQLMNFTPHGNTHCPVPNNSRPQEQIRRCVCESHIPRTAAPHTSPTLEFHIPRNKTTQTIARVWNCHRNKVAKDHRIENNSSKNKHRARCWTHSSRWVARRMGHFRSERWTIDETCSKVLWFDYVMCTELYDHTGDNNGTIKQNTELNHTPTQSVPTQPIYVH